MVRAVRRDQLSQLMAAIPMIEGSFLHPRDQKRITDNRVPSVFDGVVRQLERAEAWLPSAKRLRFPDVGGVRS